MSHAPQTPKRFTPDHQQTNPAPAAQPQLETSARGHDKVILGPAGEVLGPAGEVLVRHSDRPFLGLHQHYKGLEGGGHA